MTPPIEPQAPKRIQRSRAKGWKMPEGAVYVGRQTKWGNPYQVGDTERSWQATVVEMFKGWLGEPGQAGLVADIRRELRGKDLACWCKDTPCHADVLLKLANAEPSDV